MDDDQHEKVDGLGPEVIQTLEHVFIACDETNSGCVKVSKFVSFMKEQAANSEIGEFMNDLTDILDPTRIDPLIDWSHCILGLQDWITTVNKRSINTQESMPPQTQQQIEPGSPIKLPFIGPNCLSPKYTSTAKKALKHLDSRRYSLASTYSNESLETSELSWDHSDIHTRMEELEITNKRLLEENYNLRKHLDTTEDQNMSVLQENDGLKIKISKCEKMIDESRQVNQGYEELKTTVLQFENMKNELHEKLITMERENKSLQTTINGYENKVSQLDTTIENLKEEKEKLAVDLSVQKSLLNQIEDLKTSHENVVEESASKSEYFASVIAELSLANEVLKAQKTNVENELSELKQEFSHSVMLQGHGDITSSESLPQSLHQELKAELVNNTMEQTEELPTDSPVDSPLKERYSLMAKQCREKFIEKKEIVIGKIDEIIKGKNHSSEKFDTSIIVDELNKELEGFTEKITEFAQGKQNAEKRAIKLVSTIRKLRDENIALQGSRDKALLKFGDLSISSLESEEKLQSLTRLVDEKIGCIEDLTRQMQILRNDHSEERCCYEEKIKSLNEKLSSENYTSTSRKEIDDLKTLVEDLKNINREKTKKIYDLEDYINTKEENLKSLEENISLIEEKLVKRSDEHKTDMENIYRLIPNTDSSRRKSAINFEDIRAALERYIETTRHECNKLLGVRESPDGGPHQTDNINNDEQINDVIDNNNIPTSVNNHPTQTSANSIESDDLSAVTFANSSSQTHIDMVAMTKIYEKFDNTSSYKNTSSCSLENISAFETIPVEELPADLSFAEHHLCSVLEEQLEAAVNMHKTDLYHEASEYNDFQERNNENVSRRSSPTGKSFESSSRTDNSEQFSFDSEPKIEAHLAPSSPKIFIESFDDGIIRTAQDSDFSTNPNIDRDNMPEQTRDISEQNSASEPEEIVSKSEKDTDDNDLENPRNESEIIDENENESEKHTFENEITPSVENVVSCEIENLSALKNSPQLELITNSECNSDSDIERLPSKLANLDISNIIEFDRSDMSSDSDGEVTRRMSLASRRRYRISRRTRAASEMHHREEAEAEDYRETKSESNTPLIKQRRIGVSAEPVRVSWSALREAFKKQNIGDENQLNEEETIENESNEPPLIVTLEDVETNSPPSVLLAENQQTSFDTLPNEESEQLNDIQHGSGELTSNSMNGTTGETKENGSQENAIESTKEEKSPKSSLQVPPGIVFESMMDSLPLRYQVPFQEDKELERKFNNAVFSFHTDQYTLPKRLENQERARDVAESGMDKEIDKLNTTIMHFVSLQTGSVEFDEVLSSLQSQTSVLQKAAMKISAQSEQHGCYQQENRQVANISVMIKYADHLRTHIAKLTEEIAEYRKRLADPERWRTVLPQEREDGETKGDDESKHSDEENVKNNEDEDESAGSLSEKRKSRHSFSSISKTLIMANGLSKLQGSRRTQHLSAPLLKRRKRVSFGQVDYSDDVIDLTSPSKRVWEKPLDYLKEHRGLITKLSIVLVLFLLVLLFFFMLFKSIEVEDRYKLIDKILYYVPHTIEHKTGDD